MITEILQKAIEQSGKTRYRISMDTGINQSILSRLVNQGVCSLNLAEKLFDYLELELKPVSKKRGQE